MTRSKLERRTLGEAPHRISRRLHSARHAAANEIENLERIIRHAKLPTAQARDLSAAARRCKTTLTPDTDSNVVAAVLKQTRHLEEAATALNLAARTKLATPLNSTQLHALEEAVDSVLWHVRADRWNGDLCRAVGALRNTILKTG